MVYTTAMMDIWCINMQQHESNLKRDALFSESVYLSARQILTLSNYKQSRLNCPSSRLPILEFYKYFNNLNNYIYLPEYVCMKYLQLDI